jgi:hypothetical protein
MAEHIAEIRNAARASRCHIADLLADVELDRLICTVMEAQIATGWRLLPPSVLLMSSDIADLLNAGLDRRIGQIRPLIGSEA